MTQLLIVTVIGGMCGYAVFLLIGSLTPKPVPLKQAMNAFSASPTQQATPQLWVRIGRFGLLIVEGTGLVDRGALEHKLRILNQTSSQHAAQKVLGGLFGLALGVAAAVGFPLVGIGWSRTPILVVALALAVGGWFYPDLVLGDEVEERRQSFRYSLSAYLDLVTSLLAGGVGLETALHEAAEAGGGWAFSEIRQALLRARLTGRTIWEVLGELADTFDIEELREIAASAELAGGQGAQIRASLVVKADSLRTGQLASIRAAAESASTKMQLPSVLFVVGLIVFLLYGILSIETSLSPTDIKVVTEL